MCLLSLQESTFGMYLPKHHSQLVTAVAALSCLHIGSFTCCFPSPLTWVTRDVKHFHCKYREFILDKPQIKWKMYLNYLLKMCWSAIISFTTTKCFYNKKVLVIIIIIIIVTLSCLLYLYTLFKSLYCLVVWFELWSCLYVLCVFMH